jgi:hypothetical protein
MGAKRLGVLGLASPTEVESKNLGRVQYVGGTLAVEFKARKGQIYVYEGIEEAMVAEMLADESIGTYFAVHIKKDGEGEVREFTKVSGWLSVRSCGRCGKAIALLGSYESYLREYEEQIGCDLQPVHRECA